MTIDQKMNSCPYQAQDHIEQAADKDDNQTGIKAKVFQTGHAVIQYIGDVCPYARGVTNWAKNSFSYFYDGNIPSLFKIMRIGDTDSYERFKTVSIAHNYKLIIVTDPDIIGKILSEFRDGKHWSGGPEFVPVGLVTGYTNPLTEKDKSRQGILKSYTMNNHFSPTAIREKSVDFLHISQRCVDDSFAVCDDYDTFNITETISPYALNISAKVILGLEEDCSDLVEVIGTLEKHASDMIVCNPSSLIPNILDSRMSTSQDKLERTVKKIIDEADNGQGIATKMQQEPRYNEVQVQSIQKIKDHIESDSKTQEYCIKTVHKLITNKFYQSHFFELAEEYQYDIPYLKQLSELEGKDLKNIREDFFESLERSGELAEFLDIVSLMIVGKDGNKFDQEQVADIIKTILLIGSGTTNSSIVSSLYCLLKNPEEQEKLFHALNNLNLEIPSEEEWRELTALKIEDASQWEFAGLLDVHEEAFHNDKDYQRFQDLREVPMNELTQEEFELIKSMKMKSINYSIYNKLMKCPELENFIKEVMRMFPPIAVQARQAKQEIQINDLTVPEGWTVFLANILSYNDETRWENPTLFTPSRFEDKSKGKPTIHPFNYATNQCMGRFQALSSIKSIIYSILMKYRIHPPLDMNDNEIDQNFILCAGIALKFDKPLWARFEER
jgi:Cytochrome P450